MPMPSSEISLRWLLAPSPSRAALAAVLLAASLYGDVRTASADVAIGSSSAGFLTFEVGARPAGMAGANVASASGVAAQFWNPAGLAGMTRSEIGAMHASWLGDLKYEWLGYARPLGPRTGVGSISLAYFHLPSIAGVDAFDNPTGEFRVYDAALTAGLARSIGRGVAVGANAKYIRQNLAGVAGNGVAVDLGATGAIAGTTVGIAVQNLGPEVSLGGASNPLPRLIRFGASRAFYANRVLVAADYNRPSDYYDDIRLGTEFRFHDAASLRVGYRHELGAEDDPSTGLSFGAGIHVQQFNVDYAMTPSEVFDNVHRLSLGYSFGGGTEEAKPAPKRPEPTKPVVPPPPQPKGPPVIASAKPNAAPSAPPKSTAAPSESPARTVKPVDAAPKDAVVATAPKEADAAPAPAPKPAPSAYEVVLGSYQTEEAAKAEIKALQILGFQVKDAKVTYDSKAGYRLTLARMNSRKSADALAESLSRMSFQPRVETVQR